jgi:hypothetical protein
MAFTERTARLLSQATGSIRNLATSFNERVQKQQEQQQKIQDQKMVGRLARQLFPELNQQFGEGPDTDFQVGKFVSESSPARSLLSASAQRGKEDVRLARQQTEKFRTEKRQASEKSQGKLRSFESNINRFLTKVDKAIPSSNLSGTFEGTSLTKEQVDNLFKNKNINKTQRNSLRQLIEKRNFWRKQVGVPKQPIIQSKETVDSTASKFGF